ncbi:hypothetical protein H0H81_003938, partial [Sphagnurus paluster]
MVNKCPRKKNRSVYASTDNGHGSSRKIVIPAVRYIQRKTGNMSTSTKNIAVSTQSLPPKALLPPPVFDNFPVHDPSTGTSSPIDFSTLTLDDPNYVSQTKNDTVTAKQPKRK